MAGRLPARQRRPHKEQREELSSSSINCERLHIRLDIPDEQLASFLASLGLGVLRAIADGRIPADTGVATLGRPRSWKPLVSRPALAEIAAVFAECDELASLKALAPADYDAALGALNARLEAVLSTGAPPSWTLDWEP